MHYPVVIHKDKASHFGVTVPDLPGCFSAGTTLDDALAMAKEAIELHLETLIEAGQSVPRPSSVAQHAANPDFADGTWALVSINPESLRFHAVRINITVPQRALEAIDRYARGQGESRSGLLVKAAIDYIGRESVPRSPKPRSTARKASRPR